MHVCIMTWSIMLFRRLFGMKTSSDERENKNVTGVSESSGDQCSPPRTSSVNGQNGVVRRCS